MFEKEFHFRGIHAQRASQLDEVFDPVSKLQLFPKIEDVYINAPMVGFLYGRMAELDKTKDPRTNKTMDIKVFVERVLQSKDDLTFNFQMIMLLDEDYEPDIQKRIDKAFIHMGEDPEDENRFNSYARGGVDVLYERLIDGTKRSEDIIHRLYNFVQSFQEKFNDKIVWKDIVQLADQTM